MLTFLLHSKVQKLLFFFFLFLFLFFLFTPHFIKKKMLLLVCARYDMYLLRFYCFVSYKEPIKK